MKKKSQTDGVWDNPGAFAATVRLGIAQVQSVSPEELPFVLAYELEPASGIPASQAEVEWRETEGGDPAVRVFEVRLRRRGEMQSGEVRSRAAVAAVCCSVLAAVAIAFDAVRTGMSLSSLEKEVAVRSKLTASLESIESSARAVRSEIGDIRNARAGMEAAAAKAASLRSAYSSAMGVVASVCVGSGKSFVRAFSSPEPFLLEIKAVSENAQTASATMSGLARAVSEKGWTLSPGEIRLEGGMASFSCTIDMGGGK